MKPRATRQRVTEPLTWITLSASLAVIALGATMLAYAEFVLEAPELFKLGLASVLVGVMGLWVALRMRRLTGNMLQPRDSRSGPSGPAVKTPP